MSYTIAVTGKGGVGKTTISGLIIKSMLKRELTPILVVDADPNSCLDSVLGVKVAKSIGCIREEARQAVENDNLKGISKQELLELKISESLVESEGFDLIAMGRPEGPGCYCYANNVLKSAILQISASYPFVLLDNEAGLENLSRRIVQKVDLLLIVSDPSNVGIKTVERLCNLADEMKIEYKKLAIIINRLRNGKLPAGVSYFQDHAKADIIIGLPDDNELAILAEEAKSLEHISEENAVLNKIDKFVLEWIQQ